MDMSNSPRKSIHKINEIRASLKAGHISFDEAKALAYPLIKEMKHSAEKNENNKLTENHKIAVGYCRVSTDEQADNGLSIEVQEQVCRKVMIDDGCKILNILKDEGKSGGSMERKGIREIMRLVAAQEIQAVY